jgi:hypothetical protein
MREYLITAVKHNESHNGKQCAMYWSINSEPSHLNRDYHLYDHWFCRKLPEAISEVLETAQEDPTGYGLKRGFFILVLKDEIKFEDFGRVQSFKDVVSITMIDV